MRTWVFVITWTCLSLLLTPVFLESKNPDSDWAFVLAAFLAAGMSFIFIVVAFNLGESEARGTLCKAYQLKRAKIYVVGGHARMGEKYVVALKQPGAKEYLYYEYDPECHAVETDYVQAFGTVDGKIVLKAFPPGSDTQTIPHPKPVQHS